MTINDFFVEPTSEELVVVFTDAADGW